MSTTTQETTSGPRPVDIMTMREAIARVLPRREQAAEDLETLTCQLRGHIELMIRETEQAARRLPRYYPPRDHALVSVWLARNTLQTAPPPGRDGPSAHLRELAHTLKSLCDRQERLLSR